MNWQFWKRSKKDDQAAPNEAPAPQVPRANRTAEDERQAEIAAKGIAKVKEKARANPAPRLTHSVTQSNDEPKLPPESEPERTPDDPDDRS